MGKRKQWDAAAVKALKPGERYFAEGIGVRKLADGGLTWWRVHRVPVAQGARGRGGTKVEWELLKECRTKSQAEGIVQNVKGKIFTGEYQPRVKSNETTFAEFVETFLLLKGELKTVKKYKSQFTKVFIPLWGKRALRSITTLEIMQWYAKRKQTGALATANRELAALKSFFATACDPDASGNRLLQFSPAARIKLGEEDNARDTVLSDEQMATIARAAWAQTDYIQPFYFLLDYQGPRMMSVLELQVSHVNLAVPGEEEICLLDHKTGERKWMPLHPYPAKALRWWFAVGGPSDRYIFPGRGTKGHMTKPYVRWREFVASIDMPWLTPHDLRHNFNSQMDKQGVGGATIRAFTLHKTERMRTRYTHAQMQAMREAVNRLGSAAADNVTPFGGVRKHSANIRDEKPKGSMGNPG
jgi:integrase